MRIRNIILLIIMSCIASNCMIFEMEEEEEIPRDTIGFLEIEFIIPEYQVPEDKIHLVELSIALDSDSLSRGFYVRKANVSDSKLIYRFELLEREYYYKAAITCGCLGDTCREEGFPGGRYGIKYAIGKVSVEGGKTIRYQTNFN